MTDFVSNSNFSRKLVEDENDCESIQDILAHLRKWIQMQPHLKPRTNDRTLLNFLKGSKCSIQRAKEKIDCFYSLRTLSSEFFYNRDPFAADVQEILKAGLISPLPNKSSTDDFKMCYFQMPNTDVNVTLVEFIKVLFMVLDVLLIEEDNIAEGGLQLIADYKHVSIKMLGEFSPKLVKSFLLYLQAGYPIRLRGKHSVVKMAGFDSNSISRKLVEDENDCETIQDILTHLRKWIQMQPHLNARTDDRTLINFIKGSKCSIQRAKEKIDCFYSLRTLSSEYFNNRDPFAADVQKILKSGLICPLPNKSTLNNFKICYVRVPNTDMVNVTIVEMIKVLFMILDILLIEEDNFAEGGLQVIGDYKNFSIKMLGEFSPKLVKSFLLYLQAGYPLRFRGYLAVNAPDVFGKVVNAILQSFVNEKTRKKVIILGSKSSDEIFNVIDKSLLPEEMGGQNGSLPKIGEAWKTKLESYRDWFLDDVQYCSNECLRINKLKYKNEEFGVDGSFRKLNVD
ncbi:hypothetical protein FQR65_LT11435 [Abscondita terminalis]|nr:hypothetical protein FQR65_LT11435 [Abscondita terminalis]